MLPKTFYVSWTCMLCVLRGGGFFAGPDRRAAERPYLAAPCFFLQLYACFFGERWNIFCTWCPHDKLQAWGLTCFATNLVHVPVDRVHTERHGKTTICMSAFIFWGRLLWTTCRFCRKTSKGILSCFRCPHHVCACLLACV